MKIKFSENKRNCYFIWKTKGFHKETVADWSAQLSEIKVVPQGGNTMEAEFGF